MNKANLLILAAFLLLPVISAIVHPEGFSGMHVKLSADRVGVAVTVHPRDMGTWFPPARNPDYVADVAAEMERTATESCRHERLLVVGLQPDEIFGLELVLEAGRLEAGQSGKHREKTWI